MTKRTAFQGIRRQIRRALNLVGEDGPTHMGLSKARRIGYGAGVSTMKIKPKERQDDRD